MLITFSARNTRNNVNTLPYVYNVPVYIATENSTPIDQVNSKIGILDLTYLFMIHIAKLPYLLLFLTYSIHKYIHIWI